MKTHYRLTPDKQKYNLNRQQDKNDADGSLRSLDAA